MKLNRNFAKWEFSIHLNADKGPNRITFNPYEAERFFKGILNKKIKNTDPIVRVKHLESKLIWEADSLNDLNYFINTVVHKAGINK